MKLIMLGKNIKTGDEIICKERSLNYYDTYGIAMIIKVNNFIWIAWYKG